jgi:hypothetical protein
MLANQTFAAFKFHDHSLSYHQVCVIAHADSIQTKTGEQYNEPVAKPAFLHKSDDFGASPRSVQIGISDWA